MKKKLLLVLIIPFLLLCNKANAAMGDLRYDVTNLTIGTDGTITFKGWAFIHKTHNFVTVYEMSADGEKTSKTVTVRDKDGKEITDGGQRITIAAYYKDTLGSDTLIEEKTTDAQTEDKEYNFYCQMYYSQNINKSDCGYKTYNGNSSIINSCDENKDDTQCYYEDIGFKISFDITSGEWKRVPENADVYFKISATNTDYQRKKSNTSASVTESLYIREGVLGNTTTLENDYLAINSNSLSKQVKFIATTAWLRNCNNKECTDRTKKECKGQTKSEYYISLSNNGLGFENGYLDSDKNNFPKETYGPGEILIKTKPTLGEICEPGYDEVKIAWASWVKPSGETYFKIKVKNDKKCEVSEPNSTGNTGGSNNSTNNGNSLIFSCNQNNNSGNNNGNNSENSSGKNIKKKFDSTCNELTVKANDSIRANVKITQTGSISGLLSPSSVYQGGGFNFGLLYSNTVSWSINSCSKSGIDCNEEDKEKIGQEMANKIKTLGDFTGNLNLGQIKFGKEDIDANFMYKSCTDNDDDNLTNFKKGQSLITTCLFHLPDSVIESYTGKVTYNIGDIGSGINNKYYTPMNYFGNYNITIDTISGMSRITDKSAITDSADKSKPWTGNWNGQLTDCLLNVRGRFYSNPGESSSANKKTTYAFIYRPIDIKNPFPNRNAGINWFEWYKKNSNKNKLEESYKYLQYTVNLDNKNLSTVKSYNKDKNYLSWDNIENNTSEFIDEYDFIKRKETNIPKEGNK